MGEAKKKAEALGLQVVDGGKTPPPRPRMIRWRELPPVNLELYQAMENMHKAATALTDDAPKDWQEWVQVILSHGCRAIDMHITNLIQENMKKGLSPDDGKSVIELDGKPQPIQTADLATVLEILHAHKGEEHGQEDASGGDSGSDRGGEGHDSPLPGA